MKRRYPGITPFRKEDQAIFFGRDTDIRQLSRLIKLEPTVVLSGKSGLGKSSLLNAGVMPKLELEGYETLSIRLGAFDEKLRENPTFSTPRDNLFIKLREDEKSNDASHKLTKLSSFEESLWVQAKKKELLNPLKKGLVLVLDQFEELFTWSSDEILAFRQELAELVNADMPKRIAEELDAHLKADQSFLSDAEYEATYAPLRIKVVMAIRADRLSLLNQLTDVLPGILKETYDLKPLDLNQARSAITLPAQQSGAFLSAPFQYEESALNEILSFLQDDFHQRIESFQLQLLCQYVEEDLAPKKRRAEVGMIKQADLPELESIFGTYYERQIKAIPVGPERDNVRKLIEEGLIFEKEERRLTLFQGVIEQEYGISEELLNKLVATRLVRAEPLAEGGYAYEVSHDTLVPPILEAKKKRKLAQQRRRILLGGLLGIGLIIGLAFLVVWINRQRLEAVEARAEADSLKLVAEKNLIKALTSDSIAKERLVQALFSDSMARVNAREAIFAQQETEKQLTALQLANRQRVTELVKQAPERLRLLEYEEALRLVHDALSIEANFDPELRKVTAELIYFYTEAEKSHKVWCIYEVAMKKVGVSRSVGIVLDSLQQLKDFLPVLAEKHTLDTLALKYYPDMVRIKGGAFIMGRDSLRDSSVNKYSYFNFKDETPAHVVMIDDFSLGRTEVTAWQYRLYCEAKDISMAYSPPWRHQGDHPIVNVNWYQAAAYTNWLSEKKGFIPAYNPDDWMLDSLSTGYRLPTEAEWEFAAGGGWNGRSSTGYRYFTYAGSNRLLEVAWYAESKTDKVGIRLPNQLALYDMSGNVMEWCHDRYDKDYYQACQIKGVVHNPKGLLNGDTRVVRGGSWRGAVNFCRVAYRDDYPISSQATDVGFRVSRY
ncbi:MAG: SUMF1/EgtB/PvdO family nonheme iron enzyme [Bacteroidota bacterium]